MIKDKIATVFIDRSNINNIEDVDGYHLDQVNLAIVLCTNKKSDIEKVIKTLQILKEGLPKEVCKLCGK